MNQQKTQEAPRYFVTPPVDGGYQYYDIRDRKSKHGMNFSVVTFHKSVPGVEGAVAWMVEQLNNMGEVV